MTLDLIYKGTKDGLLAQDLQSIMQGSRRSHCSYTQSIGGFCKSVPFSYSTQFPASLLAHNYLLCWVFQAKQETVLSEFPFFENW